MTDVAVVTGAGGGIGLACVERLLKAGMSVVGGDLRVDAFNEHPDLGERLHTVEVDLTSPNGGQDLLEAAVSMWGAIDVLVNSAGAANVRPGFLDTTDEEWEATLALNLMGYVRTSRAALKHMIPAGRGSLVHIASEAARMPNPRLPDYSVSKAAVLMLSKTLAQEFTPQGIRSNVVSPAFIRSPLYDRAGGLADQLAEEFGTDRETALQQYVEANAIPVGRLGTVDEVASMVAYLTSAEASFISGANFMVDGGVTPVV